MNRLYLAFLLIPVITSSFADGVRSCVRTTFNVTYDCGAGTLVGALPDNQVVEYGAVFAASSLNGICTPPAGYEYRGHDIIADGVSVARLTDSGDFSFGYRYTTDITITPYYIAKTVATPAMVRANLGMNSEAIVYDAASQTWSVTFPYGTVDGVAHCASVAPTNSAYGYRSGLVMDPVARAEITADTDGGLYCFCRLSDQSSDDSQWVFYYKHSTESLCASLCAEDCSVRGFASSGVFRGAIITGLD